MTSASEEGKKAKAAADKLLEQQKANAAQNAWSGSLASGQAAWKDYLAKLDRNLIAREEKGGSVTHWDAVQEAIDKASHIEQNSYHDWRSAMMAILDMCSILNRAIGADVDKAFASTGLVSTASSGFLSVADRAKNYLMDKISGAKLGFDLPTLAHSLKMGADNKIDFGSLKGFDDELNTQGHDKEELNNSFRALVSLWLAEKGYTPVAGKDGVYENLAVRDLSDPTRYLTTEKFDELKNDDLDEFLKNNTDLEFRPSGP